MLLKQLFINSNLRWKALFIFLIFFFYLKDHNIIVGSIWSLNKDFIHEIGIDGVSAYILISFSVGIDAWVVHLFWILRVINKFFLYSFDSIICLFEMKFQFVLMQIESCEAKGYDEIFYWNYKIVTYLKDQNILVHVDVQFQ